jgi:hypothetical protein
MPNNIRQQVMYLGPTGDPEQFQDSTLFYPGTLGASVTIVQPTRTPPGPESGRSKTYQLVQTDSTMTVSPFPGAVAWWSDKTKYQTTTTVATLGRGRIAGVYQGSPTKGNYCYIQTGGPATVKFVDAPTAAPTAAGLIVIPSATAGKADCLAAGSAATYPPMGVSASALNLGDQTAIVDLDVPSTT